VSSTQASGDDFVGGVLPSGTVSFAAGDTSKMITVEVNGDSNIENDERFTVSLFDPAGATITTASADGTITNDDLPAITLAVSPTSVVEDGSSNLVYTFTRTGPTTNALTVNYTVSGTATIGSDYSGIATTPITKAVSFEEGSATATVTVDPTVDAEVESDEMVELSLAAGTGYTIGTIAALVGTIINDDYLPSLDITATDATKVEGSNGSTAYTFTVNRSGDTSGSSTAAWAVSSAQATGDDFYPGILSFDSVLFESTSIANAWQVATNISGVDGLLSTFIPSGFVSAATIAGRESRAS
jgi:hypothetical protein